MPLQVTLLEPVPVDGCNDLTHQHSEWAGYRLEFLVEWVVQQILIHIADEVEEALLLGAVDGVIGRVEIRDQHTFEILEQLLEEVTLACWSAHERDFFEVREDPDIHLPGLQLQDCLIDVQELSRENLGEELLVGPSVVSGHQRLEDV